MRYHTPEVLLIGTAQSLVLDDSLKSDVISCEPWDCVSDHISNPTSRCDVSF
jgi:hypothetical protein